MELSPGELFLIITWGLSVILTIWYCLHFPVSRLQAFVMLLICFVVPIIGAIANTVYVVTSLRTRHNNAP